MQFKPKRILYYYYFFYVNINVASFCLIFQIIQFSLFSPTKMTS